MMRALHVIILYCECVLCTYLYDPVAATASTTTKVGVNFSSILHHRETLKAFSLCA